MHAPWKPVTTRNTPIRCFSAHQPFRTAGEIKELGEEQGLDLRLDGQAFAPVEDCDPPERRDTSSSDPSAHGFFSFMRRMEPKSHYKHWAQTNARRNALSPRNTLREVPVSSENDGNISGGPKSSHASSSSEDATSNLPRDDRNDIERPPELDSQPGQRASGIGTEHHVSKGPSVQPISLSQHPEITRPTARNHPSNGGKRGKSLSVRRARDSKYQAGHMTTRFPWHKEGELQGSIIKQKMRQCMRRVPQSAVIVTARNIDDPQNPWRGATVSSFTTVTFEPEVIVSLNLKLPSATFDAIQVSNHFDVRMLKANDIGAAMASRFAKGHAESPFSEAGRKASPIANRRPRRLRQTAPPLLHEGHGIKAPVAFHVTCRYMPEKAVRLGDHVVIFGIVKRIPERSDNHLRGESCLAYVDGCYGSVKPFSRQPQEKRKRLRVGENHTVLSTTSTRSSISREDLLDLKSHAIERIEYFEESFLAEWYLIGLRPQTISLVRQLRQHGTNVLNAIREMNEAVNLPPSFTERPEHSSEDDKSYLPSGGLSKLSNDLPEFTKSTSRQADIGSPLETIDSAEEAYENGTNAKFRDRSSPSRPILESTPMMASASVSITPFRGFASRRKSSQTAKSMHYKERTLTSKNSGHEPLRMTRSSVLPLPMARSMRTMSAESSTSFPLTSSAHGAAVDQSVIGDQQENTGRKRSGVELPTKIEPRITKIYHLIRRGFVDDPPFRKMAVNGNESREMNSKHQHIPVHDADKHTSSKVRMKDGTGRKRSGVELITNNEPQGSKTCHLIRPGFVDYPPFRKIAVDGNQSQKMNSKDQHISVDEVDNHTSRVIRLKDSTVIRKHYTRDNPAPASPVRQIGARSRKTQRGKASTQRGNDINTLVERVLIRKHLTRDNRFLPASVGRNQAQISDKTGAERTDDVEALIKGLLYGSDPRIKKHLSTNKFDDPSDVSLPSHMSSELHQLLRQNVGAVIRLIPIGQQTANEAEEMVALQQQHQEIQELATTEAMRRDIEDVMGQIQEYFKGRSREEVGESYLLRKKDHEAQSKARRLEAAQWKIRLEGDLFDESFTGPGDGSAAGGQVMPVALSTREVDHGTGAQQQLGCK